MVRRFLFVLVSLFVLIKAAELCDEGQFQTGWLTGCADCPSGDPEKYCDDEGEYADNCKISCIKGKQANIKIKHRMAYILITY